MHTFDKASSEAVCGGVRCVPVGRLSGVDDNCNRVIAMRERRASVGEGIHAISSEPLRWEKVGRLYDLFPRFYFCFAFSL